MGSVSIEELEQFRDTAARLSADWTGATGFDRMLDECRGAGLLSLIADEATGGLGLDADALCAVAEPLAGIRPELAALVVLQACAQRLLRGLDPDQIPAADELLGWPGFAQHDQATGVYLDQGRLRGELRQLPLVSRAEHFLVPVSAGEGGWALLSPSAVAPLNPVRTLGLRHCDFGDVRVDGDAERMVAPGREGDCRNLLAVGLTAVALGIMKASFHTARDYAEQRRQGGAALSHRGEVRRLLASMRERIVMVEAARWGLAGREGEAEWVALQALEMGADCTSNGVQLLGGNGYMEDFGQEARMRDIRQLQGFIGGMANRRRALAAGLVMDSSH